MAARLEVVLRRTATLLPGDLGRRVLELVSTSSLAIMAGAVAIWAGSHFVGVGEVADVVLLVAGWVILGGAALAGAHKLLAFATATASAKSTADLDGAAQDLAAAITTLGVDVVLGLLLRGKPETTFKEPYKPEVAFPSYSQFVRVMPKGGPTHMYEARLVITRARDAGRAGLDRWTTSPGWGAASTQRPGLRPTRPGRSAARSSTSASSAPDPGVLASGQACALHEDGRLQALLRPALS